VANGAAPAKRSDVRDATITAVPVLGSAEEQATTFPDVGCIAKNLLSHIDGSAIRKWSLMPSGFV
jgi:hypothetical protein